MSENQKIDEHTCMISVLLIMSKVWKFVFASHVYVGPVSCVDLKILSDILWLGPEYSKT